MELNVFQRMLEVQKRLKAPRTEKGRFGNARSAEQILELAKPVCNEFGLLLMTTDDMVEVGDRNYVTSTAMVINVEKPEEIISATASAWENEVSAGLDTSQVSGKTSSYAKKYALQNLFAVDNTKDADFDEEPKEKPIWKKTQEAEDNLVEMASQDDLVDSAKIDDGGNEPTKEQLDEIKVLATMAGMSEVALATKLKLVRTREQARKSIEKLRSQQ